MKILSFIHRINIIGRGDTRPDIYTERSPNNYVSIYTNNKDPTILNIGNSVFIEFEVEEELDIDTTNNTFVTLYNENIRIGKLPIKKIRNFIYKAIGKAELFTTQIKYNSYLAFNIQPVLNREEDGEKIWLNPLNTTTDDSHVQIKTFNYVSIYTDNEDQSILGPENKLFIRIKLNRVLDYDLRNTQIIKSKISINTGINIELFGNDGVNNMGVGDYLFELSNLSMEHLKGSLAKQKYNGFVVKFNIIPYTLNKYDEMGIPNINSLTDTVLLNNIDTTTDGSSVTIKL